MSNHKLEFYGSGIERFTPTTFPDDVAIDGSGAIHKSQLETGVAIRWEYGTQLAIVIGGIYTIYFI